MKYLLHTYKNTPKSKPVKTVLKNRSTPSF